MSVNLIKILGLKVQVCFNKNTYMGFSLLLQGLSEVNTCPPVKINDDAVFKISAMYSSRNICCIPIDILWYHAF